MNRRSFLGRVVASLGVAAFGGARVLNTKSSQVSSRPISEFAGDGHVHVQWARLNPDGTSTPVDRESFEQLRAYCADG